MVLIRRIALYFLGACSVAFLVALGVMGFVLIRRSAFITTIDAKFAAENMLYLSILAAIVLALFVFCPLEQAT